MTQRWKISQEVIDQKDAVWPGNDWYLRGHGSDWFRTNMVEN